MNPPDVMQDINTLLKTCEEANEHIVKLSRIIRDQAAMITLAIDALEVLGRTNADAAKVVAETLNRIKEIDKEGVKIVQ